MGPTEGPLRYDWLVADFTPSWAKDLAIGTKTTIDLTWDRNARFTVVSKTPLPNGWIEVRLRRLWPPQAAGCPFCGSPALAYWWDEGNVDPYWMASCSNTSLPRCGLACNWMPLDQWNRRPQ